MALPKINKLKDMIGAPFRVLSTDFKSMKTDYQYWCDKKEMRMFKFKDEIAGTIQRWDKAAKGWVDDDINNYWYKDPKTGKNKNYLSEYQGFSIEFEKGINATVWDPNEKKQDTKIVKRAYIEPRGNKEFGTAKQLFSAMENIEMLGKNPKEVYLKMEKDGVGYKFTVAGQVPEEIIKKDREEENVVNKEVEEAITAFKDDAGKTQADIQYILVSTYGLPPYKAKELVEQHFSDRE